MKACLLICVCALFILFTVCPVHVVFHVSVHASAVFIIVSERYLLASICHRGVLHSYVQCGHSLCRDFSFFFSFCTHLLLHLHFMSSCWSFCFYLSCFILFFKRQSPWKEASMTKQAIMWLRQCWSVWQTMPVIQST